MAAALAMAGASVAGCQAELDGLRGAEKPGLDPPMDRFFFPTGLALTPDGRYLFVSNGNSDLKYNGGTIAVVDLKEAFDRLDTLWRPDATSLDPDVDPGVADRAAATCRYAPQSPLLVECQEGQVGDTPGVILGDLTVRVGFYPGFIAIEDATVSACGTPLIEDPDFGVGHYRLYTPVRGDPSLTYIDVYTESEGANAPVTCLDCGEGCTTTEVRDCRGGYRLEAPSEKNQDYVYEAMPDEPYGLAISPEGGFGLIAHLSGGSLTLMDLCTDPVDEGWRRPDMVDVLLAIMGEDAEGRSGGFDVVQRTAGDPCDWFYVSNRAAAQLMTVRVAGCEAGVDTDRGLRLVVGPSVVLTAPYGPLESGADLRGLAMAPDGNRLYALSRTPPSLLVLDTSLENGQPKNEIIDVVEVCPRPSVLRVRPGPLGRMLAYAVCFSSGEIYVVDTEDAQVVDRIEVGGGPHDLVFLPDDVTPARLRGYALVANFGEHTLGVIDVRPGEETYHQMVGRLGWPEELIE